MLRFVNVVPLPDAVFRTFVVNVWLPGLRPVTKNAALTWAPPECVAGKYATALVSDAATSPLPPVDTKLIHPPVSAVGLSVISPSIIWAVRITSTFPEAGTVAATAGPPAWA